MHFDYCDCSVYYPVVVFPGGDPWQYFNDGIKEIGDRDMTSQEQYNWFKEKYPDAVMLARIGDGYEAYNDDATTVQAVMGHDISLEVASTVAIGLLYVTSFPGNMLDVILPKLVRAGHRVAICDPLEAPGQEKKRLKVNRNKAVQLSLNI